MNHIEEVRYRRGGGWYGSNNNNNLFLRAAYIHGYYSKGRGNVLGFRTVLDPRRPLRKETAR